MGVQVLQDLIGQFEVRKYSQFGRDFGQVLKNGKPYATVTLANPNTLWVFQGAAVNRKGELKSQRTTCWNNLCPFSIDVELDRLLYRAAATELLELANSSF